MLKCFTGEKSMGPTLINKPVANRNVRPRWVGNDERLFMEKTFGHEALTRYEIADLYWRRGKSAPEVAEKLGLTVDSVKSILKRLAAQ
jgi:hypothetical protein